MMRISDWRKRKGKPLSPETLARILRQTAVEDDAVETYKRLTGEKIPEKMEGKEEKVD